MKCNQCGVHFCWDCMQYFDHWNVRHNNCVKKKGKKSKRVLEPEKTKEYYILKRFIEKAEKIAFCKKNLDQKKQGIKKDCIKTLFYATKILMFWEIMHYFIVEGDIHQIDDTYLNKIDEKGMDFCLFHVDGLKRNLNLLEEYIKEPKRKSHLGGSNNAVTKIVEIILDLIKDNFMRYPQRLEVPDFKRISTINIKAYNITDQFNIETAKNTLKEKDKKEKHNPHEMRMMEDTFKFNFVGYDERGTTFNFDQPEEETNDQRRQTFNFGFQRDTERALQQSMLTYSMEQYQKENMDIMKAFELSKKEF